MRSQKLFCYDLTSPRDSAFRRRYCPKSSPIETASEEYWLYLEIIKKQTKIGKNVHMVLRCVFKFVFLMTKWNTKVIVTPLSVLRYRLNGFTIDTLLNCFFSYIFLLNTGVGFTQDIRSLSYTVVLQLAIMIPIFNSLSYYRRQLYTWYIRYIFQFSYICCSRYMQ